MAGRGAVANPWLLLAISSGRQPTPSPESARRWILDHFELLQAEAGDPRSMLHKLKTFSGWYTRGLIRGARLRERIQSLRTPDEFRAAVEEYFASYPAGATADPPGPALAEAGRRP
jgi:tRNA-dihydrouridine synthase